MRMPFGSQFRVVGSAAFVTHGRDARPVINRVSKSVVTTSPHHNDFLVATLSRDRSNSCVGSQCLIVTINNGLRCLRQKSSRHNASDTRQRSENCYICRPFRSVVVCFGAHFSELIEKVLYSVGNVQSLLPNESKSRQQQEGVLACCFRAAWSKFECWSPKCSHH